MEFRNSKIVQDEHMFCAEAVRNMVAVGAAYPCPIGVVPTVVSPISVAFRDMGVGVPPKKRFILNCRYVNSHLEQRRFAYESLAYVADLLVPGGFMWSCDLSSGYYHVELHKDFHTYVAFQFDGIYYQFAVLPFGLAIAPYVFTRITRALLTKWRREGAKCIGYIDDFVFFGALVSGSLTLFIQQQARQLDDLFRCGFLVNWEKTVGRFAPVQSLIFLGFGVDSVLGRFFCP